MRLEGKVAVVTGAGRGLGEGIAKYLAAAEGCRLVINDIRGEEAQRVASEIAAARGRAVAHAGDAGNRSDVNALLSSSINAYGEVHILVNNAGIVFVKPTLQLSDEEWDRTMHVNLRGTFICSQVFAQFMVERKIQGRIINMSSKSGKQGGLWLSAYSASKFGIIGFTQSLALDLAPHGITVNAVCPGVIFTPRWEQHDLDYASKLNIRPEEVRDYYVKKIPLGRAAKSEDVARVIAFLASDDAAYMTGQAVNVTGGQEMR